MKQIFVKRAPFFAVVVLTTSVFGFAQTGGRSLVDERNVRAEMYFLASDAMQGRGSGTPFERVAAEYIGSQFMQFGLEPAGDNGFDGKPTYVQTADGKHKTWNAVGKITGSDRALSSEVILLSSHLDHLGVRENTPGDDKIFNGADDDASGSIAVLELARVLGKGIRPKRPSILYALAAKRSVGLGRPTLLIICHFQKTNSSLISNLR